MGEHDDQIVITGIAPVSALGHGADRCWDALVEGTSGLAPITRFDTTGFPVKLAGEVRHEAPERWLDDSNRCTASATPATSPTLPSTSRANAPPRSPER